jgi:hypothetical protein
VANFVAIAFRQMVQIEGRHSGDAPLLEKSLEGNT